MQDPNPKPSSSHNRNHNNPPDIPDCDVWDEFRNEYLASHGISAPEPPNFEAYLKKLRPNSDGRIGCLTCRQYKHCEFAPFWSSIRDHFRFYHLSPSITIVDQSDFKKRICYGIDTLMKRPNCLALVHELVSRCHEQIGRREEEHRATKRLTSETSYYKEKLPSIDVFLLRVQVTCDGQLLCGHPNCSTSAEFPASPTALEEHFVSHHCQGLHRGSASLERQISQDIIDIMARPGTDYSARQLVGRAKRQEKKWDSMDADAKNKAAELDKCRRRLRTLIHQRIRGMRQWSVLQKLRREFSKRHRKFRKLAFQSGEPLVRSCAKRWRRPDGLLQLGILTFRNLMLGHPPTRLKQVFFFISLSYAMVAVMKNCDIEVPFSPGVEDFWALRQTIEDEHKQPIFDRLLMLTWPEDAKHSSITNATVSIDSILDISFEEPISPGQLVGDILKGIVMRLFKAASADEAFKFSAFLDINLNPVSKTPPVPLNTDVGTNRLQKSGQGDRKKNASKPTCSADARRTVIFQQIHYFMICKW